MQHKEPVLKLLFLSKIKNSWFNTKPINCGKVLIVDDEAHIRNDLNEVLQEKGYNVITAENQEEAKKLLKSEQNIKFAIIDLNLDRSSDYSGIYLFIEINDHYPEIYSIILTAYSFEQLEENEKFKRDIAGKVSLEEIKKIYISKGGQENYIDAVLNKLKIYES